MSILRSINCDFFDALSDKAARSANNKDGTVDINLKLRKGKQSIGLQARQRLAGSFTGSPPDQQLPRPWRDFDFSAQFGNLSRLFMLL